MDIIASFEDNIKFLIIEVENQVKLSKSVLDKSDKDVLEKILLKDDYIDNLKTSVEDTCFSILNTHKNIMKKDVSLVRAIHIIAVNLERIADFCVNIARQTKHMVNPTFIHQFDYGEMYSVIDRNLGRIINVIERKDLAGALGICRAELRLDVYYKKNFDKIMEMLSGSIGDAKDHITAIFIFRYLERIGDALLNIGEALILAAIGDRIKIRHFAALEKTLYESGFQTPLNEINFSSILGSRSGCKIGKVNQEQPNETKTEGIFKEGAIKKIKLEKEHIEKWEAIMPGLPPRLFGFHEKGDTGSMLVEFLGGYNMDAILLNSPEDLFRKAFKELSELIVKIWEKTKINEPNNANYMEQLRKRMESVLSVHPKFVTPRLVLNSLDIPGTLDLISICEEKEKELTAPFTVFIHGDFNVNNIVYDHEEEMIHYIDLYRSKQTDYIQDASVFLVSNFRLPFFDRRFRERINRVIRHYLEVFRNFADQYGDKTFEMRMALALARSFYTSTRFEFNRPFAKAMFLRSIHLMETVAAHENNPPESFRLTDSIMYY